MTSEDVRRILMDLVCRQLEHWRVHYVGQVVAQSDRDCVRVAVIFEIDR